MTKQESPLKISLECFSPGNKVGAWPQSLVVVAFRAASSPPAAHGAGDGHDPGAPRHAVDRCATPKEATQGLHQHPNPSLTCLSPWRCQLCIIFDLQPQCYLNVQ